MVFTGNFVTSPFIATTAGTCVIDINMNIALVMSDPTMTNSNHSPGAGARDQTSRSKERAKRGSGCVRASLSCSYTCRCTVIAIQLIARQ